MDRGRFTFDYFQNALGAIDREGEASAEERLRSKKEFLTEFTTELSTQDPAEVLNFGREVQGAIELHERGDSLEQAQRESRAIYRSWHRAGAYDEGTHETAEVRGRVGFDSLNAVLDPAEFRRRKDAFKSGRSEDQFGAVPATLLLPGEPNPSVFASEHATLTALLPEGHNAAFFAFNEAAKAQRRQRKAAAIGGTGDSGKESAPSPFKETELDMHAKSMRAGVTRPVLFDNEDIGSYLEVFPGVEGVNKARRGHGDAEKGTPRLGMGFQEKLQDPRRLNAVFYQTFYETVPGPKKVRQDEWNEINVKYRATGHTAALSPSVTEGVPALRGRIVPKINPVATQAEPDRSSTPVTEPISPPKPTGRGK